MNSERQFFHVLCEALGNNLANAATSDDKIVGSKVARATSLFTVAGGGIHFRYSDIGASGYKSLTKLKDAVLAMLDSGADKNLASRLVQQDVWHIQPARIH